MVVLTVLWWLRLDPSKLSTFWAAWHHTFGNLTMGVDVAGLATACLCLIMKIPMNQPLQGFSRRFLPLFGCFERNLIFGAASRVLIMLVASVHFPVPGTASWNTLGDASRWRT